MALTVDNLIVEASLKVGANDIARSNYVLVKSLADLPTPVANVITLVNNYTYAFNGTTALGANHILCGISNILYGIDKSNDGITYTGTGGAIRCTDRDLSLKNFFIVASTVGGSAIALTGSVGQTKQLEIAEMIFNGCNSVGTILTGFKTIVFRQNLVINCSGGLAITQDNGDVFITDNLFENFIGTPTFVSTATASYHTLVISRNMFEVAVGQTGFLAGTMTFIADGLIVDNSFEGVGTFLSGVNFLTYGWRLTNNTNVVDSISYLPRAYERRSIVMNATNAGFSSSGHAMGTLGGTLAQAADNTTNYTSATTANGVGNFSGVSSVVFTELRSNQSPAATFVIKTGASLSNIRMWFGFTSATLVSGDDQTGSYAAFRFSSVAVDTGWTPIVDNATTNTTGTTIGTVLVNTAYRFEIIIDFANTRTYFRVTEGTSIPSAWQVLANVPLSGTGLGITCGVSSVVTGGANTKTLSISRIDANTN